MRKGTRNRLIWTSIAAALVITVVVVLVIVVDGNETGTPAAPTTSAAAPSNSEPWAADVLAVKIDNAAAARPQTGLGSADVVYVEPVEGGLTRLVAVFFGEPPAVVGPVRSARQTDIELLGQYGTPVLAFSGAAPELLPALHSAGLVCASPAEADDAYYRESDRTAPHNLYLRPGRLPHGTAAPAEPPLRFDDVPGTGSPVANEQVRYQAARFGFTWSATSRQWLLSMDGTPLTSTESGRVRASTVVLQEVQVSTAEIADTHGAISPVARTVGEGNAVVLRDGQRFTGRWARPSAQSPTTFHTSAGENLPIASGSVWVLLVPTGHAD